MVGQSHSTVEIGQCRWREGDCIVKVLLRTHYPVSYTHLGLVTLKELFIDGTKIEANANRYIFVWRGSINYHLAGLLDSIDQLFGKYNAFLQENDYGVKYGLGNAQMFVIEGMDKVREVIEKNRKRKLAKHKKRSNNRIIAVSYTHLESFSSDIYVSTDFACDSKQHMVH